LFDYKTSFFKKFEILTGTVVIKLIESARTHQITTVLKTMTNPNYQQPWKTYNWLQTGSGRAQANSGGCMNGLKGKLS